MATAVPVTAAVMVPAELQISSPTADRSLRQVRVRARPYQRPGRRRPVHTLATLTS
jgi:hypothetical protein